MQHILENKIPQNQYYCCPDKIVMITHSDGKSSAADALDGLCNHKIQINNGCVRHKRMKPDSLQKMSVKKCTQSSGTTTARTVVAGDQVEPAGRQLDPVLQKRKKKDCYCNKNSKNDSQEKEIIFDCPIGFGRAAFQKFFHNFVSFLLLCDIMYENMIRPV